MDLPVTGGEHGRLHRDNTRSGARSRAARREPQPVGPLAGTGRRAPGRPHRSSASFPPAARHDSPAHWRRSALPRHSGRRWPAPHPRQLLETIPLLIEGVAAYRDNPADDVLTVLPAAAKAMELGELRDAQGFEALEILKQYEVLETTLFEFVAGVVAGA